MEGRDQLDMVKGILLEKRIHWSKFRRCMRQAFLPQIPLNKPAHYGLELKTKTIKWLNVQRNTWVGCYRSRDNLFL